MDQWVNCQVPKEYSLNKTEIKSNDGFEVKTTFHQSPLFFSCTPLDNGKFEYAYKLLDGDDFSEPISIRQDTNSPRNANNPRTTVFGLVKEIVESEAGFNTDGMNCTDEIKKSVKLILSSLQEYVDEYLESKKIEAINKPKEEAKELDKKYGELSNKFHADCKLHDNTPLQQVAQITQGLGVGLTREVLKAFFGFFQTVIGSKGTNVIAIGPQSGGKTHVLDSGLKLIPQELVHIGVVSEGYFFRFYNGMDLTGHIFYLQDLGGDKDDEKTKAMRDILKQLSTDGFAKRGVVGEHYEAEDQYVEGYPGICYSTVLEEMINAQEKSRSVIILPPEVDSFELTTFKCLMATQGKYYKTISDIEYDTMKVQGLVWTTKQIDQQTEVFNPYLYCVTDMLKEMDDFNRKIDEFNSTLKLITLINQSNELTHTEYMDNKGEHPEIKIRIASKQDNVDALEIFDDKRGLLPTELKLINGLIKQFKPYHLEEFLGSETISFEDEVRKICNPEDDKYLDLMDEDKAGVLFTVSYLRSKHHRQRWYRENNNDMDNKLMSLHNQGKLIKVGITSDNEPVYGLNYDMTDRIKSIKPKFEDQFINEGISLYHELYPTGAFDFDQFINSDRKVKVDGPSFDSNGSELYDLPRCKLSIKREDVHAPGK